jgi:hypothetical protein
MPKRSRPYREGLLESLKDPQESAHYLMAGADDPETFLASLRDIAEAHGITSKQMSEELALAKDACVHAFVDGAEWWEFHKTGATIFQSDQKLAHNEAVKKYPYAGLLWKQLELERKLRLDAELELNKLKEKHGH